MNDKTLYEQAKELGVEIGSHESDMYIPVTPDTQELINNYRFKSQVSRFISNIDSKLWFDVPFAFTPWWDKRCGTNTSATCIACRLGA